MPDTPESMGILTGSDATARLRAAGLVPDPYGKAAEVARVNARMPDEACARLREYYAAQTYAYVETREIANAAASTTHAEAERCLDRVYGDLARTLADLDPTYSARAAEIVADLCRRLDRLHNEQTDPNGCHSHQGGR